MKTDSVLLKLLLVSSGLFCLAQSTAPATQEQPDSPAPVSSPVPELAALQKYVGHWNVLEHHFDNSGHETATVKGSEDINWALNGRWLRRVYTTATASTRYQAIGMFSWNAGENRFAGAWFDDASTDGPTQFTAEWNADTRTLVSTAKQSTGGGSEREFRVVERFEGDDRRVATTYQVENKALTKRLEVEYVRAVPCPADQSVRIIGRPEDE